ncbi:MAG: hypothetical protein WCY25_09865 [Moheibacter sp.]
MMKFLLFSFWVMFGQWVAAQGRIDTLSIGDYRIKTIPIPEKLKEISTLEYDDGHFWGLNDSGGEAEIYKFSSETGKILQTIRVSNVSNRDWEEMASNEDYFFIGDFGNNNGNRQDLAVYYFWKDQIGNEPESTVDALKIEFNYPEQKNFNPGNRATNFDCEAMFYHNGKLHLFTKEWTNNATTHYTLEVKPGKQIAKKIETFQTNYMVTGAYMDASPISNTNGFYLIGYTQDGFAFISGFDPPKKGSDKFFAEKSNKFSLPLGFTTDVGQVEGISIKPEKPSVICFSNEDFKFRSAHVEQSVQCIYSLAQ